MERVPGKHEASNLHHPWHRGSQAGRSRRHPAARASLAPPRRRSGRSRSSGAAGASWNVMISTFITLLRTLARAPCNRKHWRSTQGRSGQRKLRPSSSTRRAKPRFCSRGCTRCVRLTRICRAEAEWRRRWRRTSRSLPPEGWRFGGRFYVLYPSRPALAGRRHAAHSQLARGKDLCGTPHPICSCILCCTTVGPVRPPRGDLYVYVLYNSRPAVAGRRYAAHSQHARGKDLCRTPGRTEVSWYESINTMMEFQLVSATHTAVYMGRAPRLGVMRST